MGSNLTELLLDRAHNAVVSMDEQGLVMYWNPSAERMFGLTRKETAGSPVAELIIPERFRAAHEAGLQRFLASEIGPVLDQRIEIVALRADGSEFPIEMTISGLKDSGRWIFHAFIQDISERKDGEHEREQLVDELRRALRGSERRFDAIVGSLSDAVTIRDREHRFLYANNAALAHLGFESLEELRETPPAAIMSDYLVQDEHGGEIAMADIPSVRILRGEKAEPLLIRTVNRATGVQRWNLLKAAPLTDEKGEVEATITIIEEVTERKRAELRNAFLAEASAILASSLDYEQTLRNVAELAVPNIADWCAVDLRDGDGDRRTVAVAHIDPGRLGLAEELRSYEPDRLDPKRGMGLVLQTGEALLYPEISEEMLLAAATDDRHLELLRAVGFRSALIVPMRIGERVLGAMTLVSAESGRVLDQFDLQLAEQTAARAAVAIENSRLYSERSLIAQTLQQSLLPEKLPEIPGYELSSSYLPAIEAGMVGGDFYDVWRVKDSWMMIIGDVTGKGVQAAALTALVRHTMRTGSHFQRSPAGLLELVDATLRERPALSLCTAICMRLREDRLTLAIGGHPWPLRITSDSITEVGEHGPLLGAFEDASWRDLDLYLKPGDTLMLYTDGVTDAQNAQGARFGLERLCATLDTLRCKSPADVLRGVTDKLDDFQGATHADDTAALVLHRVAHEGDGQHEAPALTGTRTA
jgi:PAS domain S-box-containing protein